MFTMNYDQTMFTSVRIPVDIQKLDGTTERIYSDGLRVDIIGGNVVLANGQGETVYLCNLQSMGKIISKVANLSEATPMERIVKQEIIKIFESEGLL